MVAVRIRLSRMGTKNHPLYRIVAADSRSPRDGRFIEHLGNYNPFVPWSDAPYRPLPKVPSVMATTAQEGAGHQWPAPKVDENKFVETRVRMNIPRVEYWLSVGAQPSDRVAYFLERAGILPPKPKGLTKGGFVGRPKEDPNAAKKA